MSVSAETFSADRSAPRRGRRVTLAARPTAHHRVLSVALALTVVLVMTVPPAVAMQSPRRLQACVISLNEPNELEVFRTHLDRKHFDVVDIRAAASAGRPPDSGAGAGGSWLLNACTPQTSCDLIVYSAEFAGGFFGKQGASLSLQEMEEASCQARCAGLFRQPQEVFLLACNTLATKDEDSRTPEEYLRVLLDHGFDRSSAERVVELRYGPLGPSFRESLRRVFAGVPRIYGFSSVAPRGEYTAPMLTRYLRATPDYADVLLRKARTTSRNTALFASFAGTSLTQTVGLTPSEAGAMDRRHICALYDDALPVGERLRVAYGLLVRRDALAFVPTLEVFLSRHPPESLSPIERSVFAEIQNLEDTRDAVLQLVHRLNVSALQLELAHFAVLVGWLPRGEFHALAAHGAAELLHQSLSPEVVDIMCEITKHEPLHADFSADDIPSPLYADPQGLRLLSCLAPADPRVSPRVLPALQSPDPVRRQWAAYTVTQLFPRDAAVLQQLVPYLRDPSPEIVGRIRWLFLAQSSLPSSVVRAIRDVDPELLGDHAAHPGTAAGNGAGLISFLRHGS